MSLFALNYFSIFNLSSPTVHAVDTSADTADNTSSAQLSIAVPTSIALSITSTSGDSTCDDASANTLCLKWSADGKEATGSQTISVQTNNPTGYTVTVDNGDGMLHPANTSSGSSNNTTTIPFTYSAKETDKDKVKTTAMNSTANQITYSWTATPDKPNYLTNMDSYSQKVVYYATANDADANTVYPSTRRIYNFAYTGRVQTFTAPYDEKYKVEVWGASGGTVLSKYTGGNGGYSVGEVSLSTNEKLYIAVGGSGASTEEEQHKSADGGWNGGSVGYYNTGAATSGGVGSGGGATSVQTTLVDNGELANYANSQSDVVIVAGGGGGADAWLKSGGVKTSGCRSGSSKNEQCGDQWGFGGSGGGISGGDGTSDAINGSIEFHTYGLGGTQAVGGGNSKEQIECHKGTITSAYASGVFGKGGSCMAQQGSAGGGGGWYGGGVSIDNAGGGGGSGYIGSTLLSNKHMYGYNVATSDDEDTKTITGTCTSKTPIADCAKIGNGYARITYLGK